ncbi:UNVERIFIED_CONTAM: hypothetical protein Slati_1594800 [Sesamum latifolium]|uniref:Uncharacterized protein n=1 Tax=Sesamum latifolium TaxID=2727402 RepID=A0AAW2X973_9LAMI
MPLFLKFKDYDEIEVPPSSSSRLLAVIHAQWLRELTLITSPPQRPPPPCHVAIHSVAAVPAPYAARPLTGGSRSSAPHSCTWCEYT